VTIIPARSTVPEIAAFANTVAALTARDLSERELTDAVAARMRRLLAGGFTLPPSHIRPDPQRYVMYPLHIASDGAFSIAAAVWDVGQETPVHGHETWGVVGIYAGIEVETRYAKPDGPDEPLVEQETRQWHAGEVTVCCTVDDDVHRVRCGGDEPVVGIHVYGADIGTLPRRSYMAETGQVTWFVSRWAKAT
jgi:3-mercaptopropionate dioxygenase